MSEDDLPGVTLRLMSASASGGGVGGAEISIKIEMSGVVHDWDLWEALRNKLHTEGMRIYSMDDFRTELLNAMREEVKNYEVRMKNREQEIAELRHQNQVLRAAVGSHQDSG
jgi:hypothetical protein